jgi:hypothetical protein
MEVQAVATTGKHIILGSVIKQILVVLHLMVMMLV